MEHKKIVGIWLRVSTEDQAQGDSPEHHEKRARLYAEAKGWDVQTVYHLEGVSGKAVIEHPEAKKMLNDIKQGKITGLIFSKLARLARNTRELLEFSDIFREQGADLISLGENIDTSSPAGRLFFTIIAAMSQWEREEIASRVSASVPIRAKLGKQLGGQAPYGYQWVDKKFVIDEKEAPIRKLIFELFLKYKRKKTVAKELQKMGYRMRSGAVFSDTTIQRLLRDPSAKGMRRANYSSLDSKGKIVYKPESDWVFQPCPAIVEAELWDDCNRILDEQEKKNKRVGPRAVHLLSGFVRCTCGKRMYVAHTANPIYACQPCKIRIAAKDLDEIYFDQLKEFLMTEIDVTEYLSKTNEEIQSKESLLAVITTEASKLRKEKTELINLRLHGEMNKDSFAEHFKPLEERLMQIDAQLPELQAEVDFLKIQHLSSDVVLQEAKDLYTRWPTLSFEAKRGIVETITTSITIGKEDISFKLAYMPTHSQNVGNSQQNPRVLRIGALPFLTL
ncbi:MAG: recombinase family protein [Bacteroidota bacterium]|nr:recombinase family protein [Bacteroidota bacterium]